MSRVSNKDERDVLSNVYNLVESGQITKDQAKEILDDLIYSITNKMKDEDGNTEYTNKEHKDFDEFLKYLAQKHNM